ncbi:MAG: hypothetical protein DHS20C17_04090 [Cyclobacteriaceae bacterium]|nr:MAG: hypothetical protein DHS20C17_04090 [Cyclobacteriaceae bacterium]
MGRKTNTYKVKRKNKSSSGAGSFSIFNILERWLKIEDLSIKKASGAYMPQILFIMALGILYIGNGHYAENTIRRISFSQKQVQDLRADYHTLKADYMFDSKQSEVASKVKKSGLRESSEPPIKIIADQ